MKQLYGAGGQHGRQHGVLCKHGRTLLTSAVLYRLQFGLDKHRWAFGCYLVHLFFNRQRFRA
jgi:hypothetical protein